MNAVNLDFFKNSNNSGHTRPRDSHQIYSDHVTSDSTEHTTHLDTENSTTTEDIGLGLNQHENATDTTDLNHIETESLEEDTHTEDDIYAHINAATIKEDTVIITVFIERTTEGIKFAKQIETTANIGDIANTIDNFIENVQKTQIQKKIQTAQKTPFLSTGLQQNSRIL